MATATEHDQPSPDLIYQTLNAYQRTAALKAAIELYVFTAIAEGANTAASLAKRCNATERGMRILCDFLVIIGLLTKQGQQYELTRDSRIFLDRRSPAYIGSIADFLTHPSVIEEYRDLAGVVRKGPPATDGKAVIESKIPLWVEFARSMTPMMSLAAEAIAEMLDAGAGDPWKVLDVAAGHGMFGVTIAKHNPHAEIFALDLAPVLEVAEEKARAAGVASRHHPLRGSAFEVDFGSDYDLILLTNFLHHFDATTIETFLRKAHRALGPNGRAVTLEFVPNEDRVTPPVTAAFSMTMLGATPAGDAYTFSEYDRMFRNAGFSSNELRPMPAGPESVIISRK